VGIDLQIKIKPEFEFHKRDALGDLSDLGLFDSILLIAVIEHVTQAQELLRNLSKQLAPGGRLILTTPSKAGDALHHHLSGVGLASSDAAEDHEKIFTLEELKALIADAGLTPTHASTFFFGLNQLVVGEK
jgi:2-polyprenyl-3-methyl-5-hydroxy-6-metoxy-1,4-benzoquinol methylase